MGIGDANESVNYDCQAYLAGELVGMANSVGAGAAGGAKLAANQAGKEFSHFMSKKALSKLAEKFPLAKKAMGKCWWNGNYVSPKFHSLTDPYRRLKGQKGKKPMVPQPFRTLLRAPFPITGGAIGLGGGLGHLLGGQE